jgi:hypothetical protein
MAISKDKKDRLMSNMTHVFGPGKGPELASSILDGGWVNSSKPLKQGRGAAKYEQEKIRRILVLFEQEKQIDQRIDDEKELRLLTTFYTLNDISEREQEQGYSSIPSISESDKVELNNGYDPIIAAEQATYLANVKNLKEYDIEKYNRLFPGKLRSIPEIPNESTGLVRDILDINSDIDADRSAPWRREPSRTPERECSVEDKEAGRCSIMGGRSRRMKRSRSQRKRRNRKTKGKRK